MNKIVYMAAAGLLALAAGAETEITVAQEPARPVNRRVFGNNQLAYQNFANIATGGTHNVFDRGHGVWNPVKNEPVPEMVDFARKAGMTVQRFPGGCGSHRFDWKKAIGTPAERPNQKFGLPEFLRFCEATGAEPLITIACYVGNAAGAAELVEYLNAPDDGKHPWAARRAADGRKEPWNVVWFEYGNESYHGDHKTRTMTPQEYTTHYLEYRRAMQAVDPKVRLGAILYQPDWDQVILKQAGSEIDFIIRHMYTGGFGGYGAISLDTPPELVFRILLGGCRVLSERLKDSREELKAAGLPDGKPLAVTETNLGFVQDKPFPYRFSLGGALVCAENLRQFLYNPDVLMVNYWQFANEYWGMIRGMEAPYLERPSYLMQKLFNYYVLDELLIPKVKTSFFDAPGGYHVPKASGKPNKMDKQKNSANLLPKQKWGLNNKELAGEAEHHENSDGTLEVVFKGGGSDFNYYHAVKRMPGKPLTTYRITAEVRTEGLENTSGAAVQIGDTRGYNATASVIDTEGVLSKKWQTVSAVYSSLPDTESLSIIARRLAGKTPGKMFIRNVKVMEITPENLGASPLVEATITRSQDGKKMAFVLINKSLTAVEPVTLAVPAIVKKAKAESLTGPSVAATNEDDPNCVAIRPLKVELQQNAVKLQLPPHSLTGVEVEL